VRLAFRILISTNQLTNGGISATSPITNRLRQDTLSRVLAPRKNPAGCARPGGAAYVNGHRGMDGGGELLHVLL
jgi:hypothetical protein